MNSNNHSPAAIPVGFVEALPQTHDIHVIRDELCVVEAAHAASFNPKGRDILAAASRPADADQIVLQVLKAGGLESISLDESADLTLGTKFVLATGDRTFRFTIDGMPYEWPYAKISGAMLRELAGGNADADLDILRRGAGVPVSLKELVDLTQAGVEQFIKVTKTKTWKLQVQGETLEYDVPEVKVSEAMTRAGFDPKKAWHIYLIVKNQPKQEVSLDYIVDLRKPGIEKIRLMQRNVDNGDGQHQTQRRQFKVLKVDEQFLDGMGLRWEAVVVDGQAQWLVIHDYLLPAGYAPQTVQLALNIPKDYPAAQIDMFYFWPHVCLVSGRAIPSTQVTATVDGNVFQGWSRHRNAASKWDENSDNVRTHMALIETCLSKELGE
ncbi:multiubiquitin domain-containing protein [Comamonas sp. 4034]|uniref:multiubiquitin domain-containing protein n=1 Tax=Comamonas sp. 4034 TaxID=3156455 RepID=UPI003D1BBA0A